MVDDDLLKLAREDYKSQEDHRAALNTRMQFVLATAGLAGGASVAMLNPGVLAPAGSGKVDPALVVFIFVWLALLFVGVCLCVAGIGREYETPKALNEYLHWRDRRQKELI